MAHCQCPLRTPTTVLIVLFIHAGAHVAHQHTGHEATSTARSGVYLPNAGLRLVAGRRRQCLSTKVRATGDRPCGLFTATSWLTTQHLAPDRTNTNGPIRVTSVRPAPKQLLSLVAVISCERESRCDCCAAIFLSFQ